MTAALVAGLLAGYGIAVPVGAVGTYLVSLTARTTLRTGVCAALGVATADGLYALAATLGGTALASALRPVLGPLRWVCVLVLLALAAWGAVTALREDQLRAEEEASRRFFPAPVTPEPEPEPAPETQQQPPPTDTQPQPAPAPEPTEPVTP